jgi:hypothetical protein
MNISFYFIFLKEQKKSERGEDFLFYVAIICQFFDIAIKFSPFIASIMRLQSKGWLKGNKLKVGEDKIRK